jgi:hypothetical protein
MRRLNKTYWPYLVKPDYSDKTELAIQWCRENFTGRHQWIIVGSNNFYFKSEADALLFTLRWS